VPAGGVVAVPVPGLAVTVLATGGSLAVTSLAVTVVAGAASGAGWVVPVPVPVPGLAVTVVVAGGSLVGAAGEVVELDAATPVPVLGVAADASVDGDVVTAGVGDAPEPADTGTAVVGSAVTGVARGTGATTPVR